MNNFRGTSPLNLDTKGRMAMPTKYRDALVDGCEGKLVITLSQDRCLNIYPEPKWLVVENQLKNASSNKRQFIAIKRLYIGNASEVQMDTQGRISLPQSHRDHAKLEKKAVLVGQLDKFELWDEQIWSKHNIEVINASNDGSLELPDDIVLDI